MLHSPGAVLFAHFGDAILDIQWVHLEARQADHEARSDEAFLAFTIPEDVAHVLTQEALDALAELLHAIDIFLVHAEVSVLVPGLGLEGSDPLVLLDNSRTRP